MTRPSSQLTVLPLDKGKQRETGINFNVLRGLVSENTLRRMMQNVHQYDPNGITQVSVPDAQAGASGEGQIQDIETTGEAEPLENAADSCTDSRPVRNAAGPRADPPPVRASSSEQVTQIFSDAALSLKSCFLPNRKLSNIPAKTL